MKRALDINKKNGAQGFAHVVAIVLIVVIVGALGVVGFKAYQKSQNNELDVTRGCEGNGIVKMTHMPMDIEDVNVILPLGTLAGAHVTPIDHLYFYPKDMKSRDAAPVYAMADGYIVNMEVRSQHVDTGEAKKDEYRLMIQHNCDTISYFDLLTSLDSSIADKLKPHTNVRVPVKAGQEIGRVGAQSLDTAIYNYGMELTGFVNPSSYKKEPWKIHTDDFFKYFDEGLRNQMLALNPRTAEPRAGKIDYDISGKLIGNWFLEGTDGYAGPKEYQKGNSEGGKGYWISHFAIVPNAIDPSVTDISFGDYQGEAHQFSAKAGSPDPATISVEDDVVKYELVQYLAPPVSVDEELILKSEVMGTVLFQVLDGDKMKMEAFPGKRATEVSGFTSAAKVYTR